LNNYRILYFNILASRFVYWVEISESEIKCRNVNLQL